MCTSEPFFAVERMEALLAEAGLDAIVFARPASYCYFTTMPWFERMYFREAPDTGTVFPVAGYVRGRPEESFALASQTDIADYRLRGIWIADVRPGMGCSPHPRTAETIIDVLRQKGMEAGRIGIERQALPFGLVTALEELAPRIEWVDNTAVLLRLQEFKSEEEVHRLRHACQRAERGVEAVVQRFLPGVTAEHLMDVYAEAVGGLYIHAYGHYLAVHFGDSYFTGKPVAGAQLEPEMLVHIDVALTYMGLMADVGRNAYFGTRVPPEVKRLSDACNQMVDVVAGKLRPGISCAEVDRLSNETFWNLAGAVDAENTVFALHSHGLGWLPYSYPHISPPGRDEEILPGHAFTLEVKARVRGVGHFKCEDTFIMRPDRAECLNRLDRKLFVQP